MEHRVKEALLAIKNPVSGKTLEEEKRVQTVTVSEDSVEFIYNRVGISPDHKKVLENSIYESLEKIMDTEKLTIKTVSENSQEVFDSLKHSKENSTNNSNNDPAQLKVGHGTVGTKKRIPGVKNIIAIASGKGGVGKSTFTVNLAITLKNLGYKVGVIDSDIYGPSVPMLLNRRGAKPSANENKKMIPLNSYGIDFVSFGSFIEEKEPVIWRGPMLGGVLNQFFFDVVWNELDYLILDLPPGTGDVQLSISQNLELDGSIVISTPQDIALLDATKGFEMFKKLNIPVSGMVENMSSFVCDSCDKEHMIFGSGGVEKKVKELDVDFLGKIPLELALREGSDEGVPYMTREEYAGRPVWNAYNEIANNLVSKFSEKVITPKKTSFFEKFLGK